MRYVAALALLAVVAPTVGHAQNIALQSNRRGRLQYVFTGASLVDSTGLNNGANCLLASAQAQVRASDVPANATLLSATLYVGGSLFDDGEDYAGLTVFDTGGLTVDNSASLPFVEGRVRLAADRQFLLTPPGAFAAVPVSAPTNAYAAAYFDATKSRYVGFFVTPVDITTTLLESAVSLAGTYTLEEALTDVCYGPDVACPDTGTASCPDNGGEVHIAAAAAFALLLVFEDPGLPQRSVSVFEGLQILFQNSLELQLGNGGIISDPAVGELSIFTLESDVSLGGVLPNTPPCNAQEYVQVDGDTDPAPGGVCLSGTDNPPGNTFNSTICPEPDSCCGAGGSGVCGTTGVDIDGFDISNALAPGASEVDVRIGTAADRLAIAVVVLQFDVFEPKLTDDTQIRILSAEPCPTEDGAPSAGLCQRLGETLIYSVAVSNTGNIAANDVRVRLDVPPRMRNLTLLRRPEGSNDDSLMAGGASGTGVVDVSDFAVPAGEIAEVRFAVDPECTAGGLTPRVTATVSSGEVGSFQVASDTVTVGGPGAGECEGHDEDGPFSVGRIIIPRFLRGGGCAAVTTSAWAALAIVAWAMRRRAKEQRS